MEVELVAKDFIKPSSPTPHHLKTYKLTLLDQLVPAEPAMFMLVYPFRHSAGDDLVSRRGTVLLKQSLSQTLAHFYPLAGTLRDEVSIDCNDEGACYVEARVESPLSDHLNNLERGPLVRHLPLGLSAERVVAGSHVTMIQQTNFSCGGMVICAGVSHLVGDASFLSCFLKAWGSLARGLDSEHLCPNFDTNTTIFRSHYGLLLPKDVRFFNTTRHVAGTRLVLSRSFVFDGAAISRLKEQVASPSFENPTRVEVVSALLWRRIMAVFKARRSGVHRPSGITHIVNLRRRAGQLFADNSPGNIFFSATSVCTIDEPDLDTLGIQIREAIGEINGEFVKEITGGEALTRISEKVRKKQNELSNGLDHITFTSICNFGLYDVDFGWGEPVKAGPPDFGRFPIAFPFSNIVTLTDTRTGKGMEAMLVLDEQDMLLLEIDQELLSYAVLDPMLELRSYIVDLLY